MYPRMGATSAPVAAPAPAAPAPIADPGMHFTYGIDQLALAGNAQAAPQVQVVNHSFRASFLVALSTGPFSCRLRVGDRYLSNIAIHSDNLFGTAQAPMPLLAPIAVDKNDLIIFEITDLSGAPNDIRIALIGVELND
jgi:hypothetical protein